MADGNQKIIDGHMQLYSVAAQKQQLLQGHGGQFGVVSVGDNEPDGTVICFAKRDSGTLQTSIQINEIGEARRAAGCPKFSVKVRCNYLRFWLAIFCENNT